MAKKNHIHKYQRKSQRNRDVYACVLPDCTHYLELAFIVGKETICNRCGNPTIIRMERNGKIRHRPHCKDCTKFRTAATKSVAKPDSTTKKFLANLMAGVKLPDK